MLTPAALALLLLAPLQTQQPLTVAWDCYLPDDRIACTTLQVAHFSALPFLVQTSFEEADVLIRVRSQKVPTGRAYVLAFEGKRDHPSFVIEDRVLDTIQAQGLLLRLVADLQRGMAPYLALESPGSSDESGAITLRLRDPAAGPVKASGGDKTTRWYVAPSINAEASLDSISRVSVLATVLANWSSKDWRLRANFGANYRRFALDEEGQEPLSWDVLSVWNQTTIAHTIWRGLSVGTTTIVAHDPPDNQLFTIRPLFGFEWVLKPYLETDESNVGVRYVFGGEHVRFWRTNLQRLDQQSFLLHDLAAFVRWHFERVDAQLTVSGRSIVDDLQYSSVSAAGSVTWRITDDLWLTGSGDASIRNRLINTPLRPPDNPLEQIFSGRNFGTFAYSTSLSLTYAFGNSLLDSQDQRWRW